MNRLTTSSFIFFFTDVRDSCVEDITPCFLDDILPHNEKTGQDANYAVCAAMRWFSKSHSQKLAMYEWPSEDDGVVWHQSKVVHRRSALAVDKVAG